MFAKPDSVLWLPLEGRRLKGKRIPLNPLQGLRGQRRDKMTKVLLSYPEMCTCKQTNLVNSLSKGPFLGQQHSRSWEAEELCVLSSWVKTRRRIQDSNQPPVVTSSSCTFKAFEHRSYFCSSSSVATKSSCVSPGQAPVGCWAQSWFSGEGWCPSSLETWPREAGERVSSSARRRARCWSQADTNLSSARPCWVVGVCSRAQEKLGRWLPFPL